MKHPGVLRDDRAFPRKKGRADPGEDQRFRIHSSPAPCGEPPPCQIHSLIAVVQEFDILPFSREGGEHDLIDDHSPRKRGDIDLHTEPVI